MALSRRSVLASVAIATTSITGCSEISTDQDKTKIRSIRATNYRETTHTFTAVIEDDGEKVYSRSLELSGTTENTPVGNTFEEVPKIRTNATVYGYLDDQPRQMWKELDLNRISASCVEICLCIDRTTGEFVIWYSKDCTFEN